MEVSDNIFNPKHVAFGRSQTFPLRLGWLPKVCSLFADEKGTRSADELMCEWGVGKNMATAMLHWANAADVLEEGNRLTDFGRLVFSEEDGIDPYMEDETTLWLLHWNIASRPRCFTAGYSLFNLYFPVGGFSPGEAAEDITALLQGIGVKGLSKKVLSRDTDTALRMYARRGDLSGDESLESPFLNLNLISYESSTKCYYCDTESRDSLPANVVGYAAAQLLEATDGADIALRGNARTENHASLFTVFRIDEDALLQKLESFCREFSDFQLKEYAGEWQFCGGKNLFPRDDLLKAAYMQGEERNAG